MRSNAVERKRWTSVRSYLCGDEFNSVLAEEDLASRRYSNGELSSVVLEDYSNTVRTSKATIFSSKIDEDLNSIKGSEATVTQPISENSNDTNDTLENNEKTNLTSKHKAAVLIQSAFRSFLVI